MKPFIKPRPAHPTATPPPAPEAPSVTPGELSILALASAIADPAERAAYLARACRDDDALRSRIEERLGARAGREDAERPQAPAVIRAQQITSPSQAGHAMALVPMSAAQLANATAPPIRPNTIPWLAASLLAAAAGALAMLFFIEKAKRAEAESEAISAQSETAEARQQQSQAEAAALSTQTAAERTGQQTRQQRDDALAAAEKEKSSREAEAAVRAKAEERMKSAEAAAIAAREEALREKTSADAARNAASTTLAETLAALAAAQMDARNFPAAAQSAQQSLELRTALGATGWPVVELRALMGSAFLQASRDADAAREILAAATAIETLGTPATEMDKARFAAATKRILQFFTVTGRRKDGAEWRKKFDALARSQNGTEPPP